MPGREADCPKETASVLDAARRQLEEYALGRRRGFDLPLRLSRVLGADGSLTGFGGGLPLKKALLQIEQAKECGQ
jgi:O6-methylguanine-DNA--protein-cysteine methyltransferase